MPGRSQSPHWSTNGHTYPTTIYTIIVTEDSLAKQQEGWDFYFALCSETCANELRAALAADGVKAGR